MILTCSACETRYLVDPGALGVGGREVRCAKCGRDWRQAPADREAVALPPEAADDTHLPTGMDQPPPISTPPEGVHPLPPGSNLPVLPNRAHAGPGWVGWAALVLVLCAGTASAVVWRDAIVAGWPPAGRLYEFVSLPVTPPESFAFDIRNVASDVGFEAGQRVLKVSGQVVNIGPEPKSVPRLRVSIIDEGDRALYNWTVAMPTTLLAPGEAVPFTTRLPNPPKNVKRISVTFEA